MKTEKAGDRKKRRPAKLRELCFEDYPQIVALQVRNGLTLRSFAEWVSVWKGNPAYEESNGQWPPGWVIENEDGQIVGSISNVPFAYRFKGRDLRVGAACAWAVDAGYRSYSMSLMGRLTSQETADFTVTTSASPSAENALKLFNWKRVPVGTWDKSAFWITNHTAFLETALRIKSIPFTTALSHAMAGILYCREWLDDTALRWKRGSAQLQLCTEFDSGFDTFWEELSQENYNVLLAMRTRRALAWHFRHLRAGENGWIFKAFRGSRMVAYAIFDRHDNPTLMLKRARLIDFQALKGCQDVLPSVLMRMLQMCRQEGIHILENLGCWLDRPDLPRMRSPYRRSLGAWLFYYKAMDCALSEELQDAGVWVPSSFDGDVSL